MGDGIQEGESVIPGSLIIAGCRTVTEPQFEALVVPYLDTLQRPSLVISGGNKVWNPVTREIVSGADYWGEKWARARGIPVRQILPKFTTLGKKAGPIRNSEMAQIGEALVAIWDGHSRGTGDIIRKMQALRRRLRIIPFKPEPVVG